MPDYNEGILELASEYELHPDEALEVQDLADELGLDKDEAIEMWKSASPLYTHAISC